MLGVVCPVNAPLTRISAPAGVLVTGARASPLKNVHPALASTSGSTARAVGRGSDRGRGIARDLIGTPCRTTALLPGSRRAVAGPDTKAQPVVERRAGGPYHSRR